MKWIKWPTFQPPSWSTVRWINWVTAGICIALAVFAGPSWLSMIDMALGGFLIGNALWFGRIAALRESYDELWKSYSTITTLHITLMMEKNDATGIHPAQKEDRTVH